jgi:hypothetical protein
VSDGFLALCGAPPEAARTVIELIDDFQDGLAETVDRLAPVGRELEDRDEELLCRYCYLLGLFEELYRAGLGINSPLFALKQGATFDDLLALPPQIWIADLCALSRLLIPHLPELAREPLYLNPIFAGSEEIGGPGADLISAGCLIDVKTTVDAKFTRTHLLYQLLGYVFLDSATLTRSTASASACRARACLSAGHSSRCSTRSSAARKQALPSSERRFATPSSPRELCPMLDRRDSRRVPVTAAWAASTPIADCY